MVSSTMKQQQQRTSTFHVDNLINYYNYLKLGDFTKQRPRLPELNDELLDNLRKADHDKCFRKGFVAVLSYMLTLAKDRSTQQRKDTINEKSIGNSGGGGGGVSGSNKAANTTNGGVGGSSGSGSGKVNSIVSTVRASLVPDALRRCKSRTVKSALAMFCTQGTNASDTFRRDLLLAIIKDQFRDVADIVEYMNVKTDEFKSRVEEHGRTTSPAENLDDGSSEEKAGKKLYGAVKCLLEVADIMREKSYAKLAMSIDRNLCNTILFNCTTGRPEGQEQVDKIKPAVEHAVETALISKQADRHPFRTIYPYDGLINLYVNVCIPKKDQSLERMMITKNKFHVNPYMETLNMIKALPRLEPIESNVGGVGGDDRRKKNAGGGGSGGSGGNGVKRIRFQPKQLYHVYINESNFVRHLVHTFIRYNGRIYFVITYRDCVYDVIGHDEIIDGVSGGSNSNNNNGVSGTARLYHDKTWQERLDSLNGPTKIILHEKYGHELIDYPTRAFMGISWMENGTSRYAVQSFNSNLRINHHNNNINNDQGGDESDGGGAVNTAVGNGFHNHHHHQNGGGLKRSRGAARSPSPSAQTDVDETFADGGDITDNETTTTNLGSPVVVKRIKTQ